MKRERKSFVLRVTATLAVVGVLGCTAGRSAGIPREAAVQEPAYPSDGSPMQSAPPTEAELQQLVAPIALYPDALVAQILAAATYPEQIVEADRWMQQQLAEEVDKEAWDPSVEALTAFPSVLANMDMVHLADALLVRRRDDLGNDEVTSEDPAPRRPS